MTFQKQKVLCEGKEIEKLAEYNLHSSLLFFFYIVAGL